MLPVKFYSECFSRRTLLKTIGMMARAGIIPVIAASQEQPIAPPTDITEGISQEDDQFLEEVEKANFQFFLEQTDPETGLVKDRCNTRAADNGIVASIAAT